MKPKSLLSIFLLGILLGLIYLFLPVDQKTQDSDKHASHTQLITSDKPIGGEFTLSSSTGEHALAEYQGKLVLIYFGYTYCPDICPTNLGNLSVAYQGLTQDEKEQLKILFISVDPERDTVDRLQTYANYFDAGITGLTGTPETLQEITQRYGVVYARVDDPNNGTNYAVDHSAFTYVVDQAGRLQTQLPHATTPDQFTKVIRQYLNN
ncbi:MAG: SCO family protein [Gammaproteobacteria bacterium]|nr:SCO family protein [Gammaproteobacteria bacterium]